MICLEVTINGKRACLAGVGESGVVSTHVNWVKRRESEEPNSEQKKKNPIESMYALAGGLAHIDENHSEHLRWLFHRLSVGDEVTIRIIESDAPDPPFGRERVFDGCAFCGRTRSEVKIALSGGLASICRQCVVQLTETISKNLAPSDKNDQATSSKELECSFCRRSAAETAKLIAGTFGNICDKCLENAIGATRDSSEEEL